MNTILKLEIPDTGLKYPIWIGKIDNYHIPRIKVSNVLGVCDEDDYTVLDIDRRFNSTNSSSSNIPKEELEKIHAWIKINYDKLMTIWWMFERNLTEVLDDDATHMVTSRELINTLKNLDAPKVKTFMGIKYAK